MNPEIELSSENSSRAVGLINGLMLAIVTILGIVVSVLFLLHLKANYQETYNLKLSVAHNVGLSTLGSNDDPAPIYFYLERAWIHSIASFLPSLSSLDIARLLSLLFYPLSVALAYLTGMATTKDRRLSTAASLILAASPFMLWYSSRATMYSMLVFAVLLNQYFFTKLLGSPRPWHWPAYFLTAIFGLGIHYFFAFILLVQLVFFTAKIKRRHELAVFYICLILVGLVFGLWLNYSLHNTQFWHYLPYTSQPSATNIFIVFGEYLFGFQSVTTMTMIISFWPLLVVVALLAIQKYVAPPAGIKYSFWAAVAPVLAMYFLSFVLKPLFLSSYLIIGLAPLTLFLGWYFVALNLRVLSLALYGLLAAMIIMFIIEATNPGQAIRSDYLGYAKVVSQSA